MPYTSIFVGVPDGLVKQVREAVDRLRDGPGEPHERSVLIAEAVRALEATRPHVRAEHQEMLSHFGEMVMHPERFEGSGH